VRCVAGRCTHWKRVHAPEARARKTKAILVIRILPGGPGKGRQDGPRPAVPIAVVEMVTFGIIDIAANVRLRRSH
jgi:hypothetical protein